MFATVALNMRERRAVVVGAYSRWLIGRIVNKRFVLLFVSLVGAGPGGICLLVSLRCGI